MHFFCSLAYIKTITPQLNASKALTEPVMPIYRYGLTCPDNLVADTQNINSPSPFVPGSASAGKAICRGGTTFLLANIVG